MSNAIYDSDDTNAKLPFPQAIRKRPGMYMGDTGIEGLHNVFLHILRYSVEKVLSGDCNCIEVTLQKDYSITVMDNGPGVPVVKDPETNSLRFETNFTDYSPPWSHSSCLTTTNALSDFLEYRSCLHGCEYRIGFERGLLTSPLEVSTVTTEESAYTSCTWLADKTMFKDALTATEELAYDSARFRARLRELAALLPQVRFTFHDRLNDCELETYPCKQGIRFFLEDSALPGTAFPAEPIYFSGQWDETQIEIALQYQPHADFTMTSYVNTHYLEEDGVHRAGFLQGLTTAINRYARASGYLEPDQRTFPGDMVRSGLAVVIAIRVPHPMFNGSGTSRLMNPELQGYASSLMQKELPAYLQAHPEIAHHILSYIALSALAFFH